MRTTSRAADQAPDVCSSLRRSPAPSDNLDPPFIDLQVHACQTVRKYRQQRNDPPVVRVTRARTRLTALASLFGRAFVHEPMMRWPLGCPSDPEERFTCCFS